MSKIYERLKKLNEKHKAEILPCAYCGSSGAELTLDRPILKTADSKPYLYSVTCSTPKCTCSKSCNTVKEAIENWNSQQIRIGKEGV